MGRGRVFSGECKLGVVRLVANGEKRPAEVCREHGLAERLLLRWRREYEARGEAAGPNRLWVADITYVRLPTAFAYLACVLDAWSRRCVGWQLSRTIGTGLTLAALDRALAERH